MVKYDIYKDLTLSRVYDLPRTAVVTSLAYFIGEAFRQLAIDGSRSYCSPYVGDISECPLGDVSASVPGDVPASHEAEG